MREKNRRLRFEYAGLAGEYSIPVMIQDKAHYDLLENSHRQDVILFLDFETCYLSCPSSLQMKIQLLEQTILVRLLNLITHTK